MRFLDDLPYGLLIVIALFVGLAPFSPMPHIWEKLLMLKNGLLTRPIDMFDLFFHAAPMLLFVMKLVRDMSGKKQKEKIDDDGENG